MPYDFKSVEERVRLRWALDARVKACTQFEKGRPLFSWLEGPPTANAPPGLHHVEVRVYKDLICRYKYMQGHTVPRKGGWDCHGLPVEVQVEKKLKLNSKKDVVAYGVERFIEECRRDVFAFIEDWNRNTERLGFWLDLENAYATMSTPYMESVWWALAEIHRRGLLYEGYKVVPYCPRCETPLSSHEVAQGYEDIRELTITVKFKLADEDAYALAWTTTPWTLPGNVSLAVNPDLEYCYVHDPAVQEPDGRPKTYLVAKDRVARHFDAPQILKTVKGRELVGKKYEPLFPYFADAAPAFLILGAGYVTTEDGTGLVHQASAYGEADFEENRKHGVAFIHPVNRDGTFSADVPDFAGLFVKAADPLIIKKLQEEGKVFVAYEVTHSYPFCWRCATPLIYYAMEAWFIRVSSLIPKLLAHNKKIQWHPDHIRDGRFGNWLEGAKDWALSRNKFWGTPLPVWKCGCGAQQAVGSIAELEKLSGRRGITDLHITTVDPLSWPCRQCGQAMKRTPEVIDTWFDSGSAPFAQLHYPFENKAAFARAHPYDFIVEALDQTRGWFYTMHVLSAVLFNKPAYRSVAVGGILCDDAGEKMSKSKGNVVVPDQIFDEAGVDAVRAALCVCPLGEQIRFGKTVFQETIHPFFNTLWNAYAFARPFMTARAVAPIGSAAAPPEKAKLPGPIRADPKRPFRADLGKVRLEPEDRWMASRVNSLAKEAGAALDAHEYNRFMAALIAFVNEDLSRWYIKLVRERDDNASKTTLAYTFDRLLRLVAPLAPFVADELYHDLAGRAVHFEAWPKPERVDEALEAQMARVRGVVTAILAARDRAGLGVRWPCRQAIVQSKDPATQNAVRALSGLVCRHANLKALSLGTHPVTYTVKPDYGALGRTFGQKTADVVNLIEARKESLAKQVAEDKKEFKLSEDVTITHEHLAVTKSVAAGWSLAEFDGGLVFLNVALDEQLEAEGFAREVTRRLQQLRKDAGLAKSDRIEAAVETSYPLLAAHQRDIAQKVGAKRLLIGAADGDYAHEAGGKIKDFDVKVRLRKAG